ncbi:ATP-dependent RNA helicase DDX4-like [Babylonia areolata]|uniref:ATP-dependent RNA helicase DDX4-like n=1 Tax=Babylonia areolata TaxID=304850 RepID=UPI003FD234AC
MEEDWDAGNEGTSNGVGGLQSKLRGFGRGGSFQELRSKAQTNGFGYQNGAVKNGFTNGSHGKGSTGAAADDWDDAPAPVNKPGRGGFGASFGKVTSETDDGWDDTPPAATGFVKAVGAFGTSTDRFGGGKGNACFRCGESGHMSRECPQGGGSGSSGGGRGCRKCGEEGHFARECPGGGGGGGGSRSCHKCGEEGHFARECPSGGSSRACHKCGGEGHFARECPSEGGKPNGCRKCGDEGHFARECPNEEGSGGFGSSFSGLAKIGGGFEKTNGGRASSGSGCRRCGEDGHFARECPNKDGGGKGSGCHRCGEEGHFARECPKAAVDGEKPRELYIPPEVDESMLFKMSIHQGINFDKYDNIEVLVTGNNRVTPISSFEEAGLLPTFLKNVKQSGYTKPTPIQKHAIPAVLAGRDLMGCAQTGSGKTAAFLLPVLTAMVTRGLESSEYSQQKEPQAVVVAPTRELASQIYVEALKFSNGTSVEPAVVYGGTDKRYQRSRIMKGANLVVGTPGRLLDFIGENTISLEKVQYLILDEADRMLDLGFEPDIRKLVDTMGMPPKSQRQTLMFSATFKEEIQRLASDFLNNYLFITVGIVGGACSDVTQTFLEVNQLQKREHLCEILNEMGTQRVLVFVGQKRNADFLASYLSQSGYPTTSIHGDRLQREREEALRAFKKGNSSVLIATNVAARGLDIPDVAHVINYDMPSDIDEYVHRIGRTGRCGNLGKATSFYNHQTDSSLLGHLVRILAEAKQEVPDWLSDYADAYGGGGGDRRGNGRFASKDIRPRGKFSTGGTNDGAGDAGGYVDITCDDEAWD